jgi:hypothetical protein
MKSLTMTFTLDQLMFHNLWRFSTEESPVLIDLSLRRQSHIPWKRNDRLSLVFTEDFTDSSPRYQIVAGVAMIR